MPFDLRTKTMNKKGQIVSESPYTLYIENGMRVFERPPGSGEFFYENGDTIAPEHRPASAQKAEKPKVQDRKELQMKTKALNKKIKEHGESEGDERATAPELSDDDQDALDALLGED